MNLSPNSYQQEVLSRKIRLTNFITIVLFVIMILLSFFFTIFGVLDNNRLSVLILASSPILLAPYFLNRLGYTNISRFILPIVLPLVMMFLSIDNKGDLASTGSANPVNYFDVRISLFCAAIIPLVLYSLDELKWLIIAFIPSALSIILFDPLHNLFQVGYYQVGLTSYDYYFSANLFTIITFVFLSAVILFLNNQAYKSGKTQHSENKKINSYLSELVRLSTFNAITHGEVNEAKLEILKTIKSCLHINRVSLWEYNHQGKYIECEYLNEDTGLTSPKTKLYANDYPKYIKAIQYETLIIANNAETNIYTSDFSESYLRPLAIKSMLDAPFLKKGKLGGVICCEQQHITKEWSAAESILVKGLTDLLTYTLLVEERVKQNHLLTEKNAEISKINKGLENIVNHRTKELQEKNRQLIEYAYINSHILRAPVARISGLYKLFLAETKITLKDSSIFSHMDSSITELEEVTRQISRAIEDRGELNPE